MDDHGDHKAKRTIVDFAETSGEFAAKIASSVSEIPKIRFYSEMKCPMVEHNEPDRRTAPRMKLDIDGVIVRPGKNAPISCIVRDISETGARLHFDSSALIPSEFELELEHEGISAKCSVVWWAKGEVGVTFNSLLAA